MTSPNVLLITFVMLLTIQLKTCLQHLKSWPNINLLLGLLIILILLFHCLYDLNLNGGGLIMCDLWPLLLDTTNSSLLLISWQQNFQSWNKRCCQIKQAKVLVSLEWKNYGSMGIWYGSDKSPKPDFLHEMIFSFKNLSLFISFILCPMMVFVLFHLFLWFVFVSITLLAFGFYYRYN